MKQWALVALVIGTNLLTYGQDQGVFSGNLQSNVNFFIRDDERGANQSPQYLSQLSSAEAWMFLNYQIKGFNISARYDMFNNSNLLNPTGSFTEHGIGFWQIKKEIEKLEITVGSFYEQFGSGLIFRAYENRTIGIDYAMEGLQAKYQFNDNFFIKGFTGRMKGSLDNRFKTFPEIIQGINSEKSFTLFKDKLKVMVGAAGLKRTLSNNTMNVIATEINSYDSISDRFDPKYNVYSYSAYTNLNFGNFNFYTEYVGKTEEAFRNEKLKLELASGSIYYAGLNYSKNKLGKKKKGGIGVNLQYRRIEKYQMKISPNEQLLSGLMSYQPSLTLQSSYRLLARYNAPAQDYGEEGVQGEILYTIDKSNALTLNGSHVTKLNGDQLFRELFVQFDHKFSSKLYLKTGVDHVFYNQQVYESKDTSYFDVRTFTPFTEITYKFSKRNSLRFEAQYLFTMPEEGGKYFNFAMDGASKHSKGDLGDFFNALLEFNFSPHYSFAISDMVNSVPVRHEGSVISNKILHYYSVFAKYSIHSTAFTLAYIKQVEGVNCTGGICRLEPAFSGVRFTLTTNF